MPGISIIWFRDDLRVVDNPALAAASARGNRAVAVFVREQDAEPARAMGRASRWWLHHSLTALRKGLARINVPLVLRSGPARIAIPRIVSETGADAVFWNRRYGSAEIETDKAVKASLQHSGIAAESRNGSLLFEPWTVLRGGTAPYRVFTPFWKAARAGAPPADPFPAPGAFPSMSPGETGSEDLDDWSLLPTGPNWASGFEDNWEPGEAFPLGGNRHLRLGAGPAGHCVHVPAVAASQVRGNQSTRSLAGRRASRCSGPGIRAARRQISVGTRMAGVLIPPSVLQSGSRREKLPGPVRRLSLAVAGYGIRRLAPGTHGLPARRRRHARTLAYRMDAQPGQDGCGLLPRQAPAHRLA